MLERTKSIKFKGKSLLAFLVLYLLPTLSNAQCDSTKVLNKVSGRCLCDPNFYYADD